MNRMKKTAVAALIAIAPVAAFAFQPLPLRPSTSSVEVVAPAQRPHEVRDRQKQEKELRKAEHARVKAERKRAREIRKAEHERQKETRKANRH